MNRHIDFEAIENFRDAGGYATACGRGFQPGRVYRSGDHSRATEADLKRMAALDIAVIVDLRLPSERARDPSRRWDGFASQVIENDIVPNKTDWVETLKTAPLTAEWWRGNTLGHYRENPFEPWHVELFRGFLRAVGDGEGAVVIHCAAGKDRTGLACAMLQHLVGVSRDDIVADFLLTNDENRIARKMVQAAQFVEQTTGRRPTDDAIRVSCSVYPEFLDAAFEAIRERHGSLDGYLTQALGVDHALRERIRDRLLG